MNGQLIRGDSSVLKQNQTSISTVRNELEPFGMSELESLETGPTSPARPLLVAAHPEMTRYGVMDHLNVLADAGLVIFTREGRHRINHLNAVPIAQIQQRWLSPVRAGTSRRPHCPQTQHRDKERSCAGRDRHPNRRGDRGRDRHRC
jgi:hypothetical protein